MTGTCYLSTAYWPPIQYFTKLLIYNKVYIEAWETYPKQTYRNRILIYGANGIQSLQVPVIKGSFTNILIKDIEIAYSENWQKNHLKSIESAYRSSPFYEYYIDDVLPFYQKRFKYLIDYNQSLIEVCMQTLNIKTLVEFTKEFEINPSGIDLRNCILPKIEKQPTDTLFKPVNYIQGFDQRHGFVPNLSILDLIFNEGTEAIGILNRSIVKDL